MGISQLLPCLLFLMAMLIDAACTRRVRTFQQVYNKRLMHENISTVTAVSKIDCAKKCVEESCAASNYYKGLQRRCEILTASSVTVRVEDALDWTFIYVNAIEPRNCSDLQSLFGYSADGEYCVSIDGSITEGTTIYCHGMSTTFPGDYLTLLRGETENYSQTYQGPTAANGPFGRIAFSKIGLDLQNMVINGWDNTFTSRDMVYEDWSQDYYSYPAFGRAFACRSSVSGNTKIDLTGTGFFIPDSVTWENYFLGPVQTLHYRTDQTFSASCTGDCAGCQPSRDGSDHYNTVAERVVPVAYDAHLDSTACAPELVDKVVA